MATRTVGGKIMDVMHTLKKMRDGEVADQAKSAEACREVLQAVLDTLGVQ